MCTLSLNVALDLTMRRSMKRDGMGISGAGATAGEISPLQTISLSYPRITSTSAPQTLRTKLKMLEYKNRFKSRCQHSQSRCIAANCSEFQISWKHRVIRWEC